MKKLLMAFVFILGFILLFGCTNRLDASRDSYGFKNTTIQTKEEILEKIAFYSNRMITSSEIFLNQNSSLSHGFLINTNSELNTYTRDELPPQKVNNYNPDMIDPISVNYYGNQLASFHDHIDSCESFTEDVFCTIDINEQTNLSIKVRNEGNQLYIEVYSSFKIVNSYDTSVYVSSTIIYLDLIDDKIYFEKILESKDNVYGNASHSLHYDLYHESGDKIKMIFNLQTEDPQYYYDKYSRSTDSRFWFSRDMNDHAYGLSNHQDDITYELDFQEDEIIESHLSHGIYNLKFRYEYSMNGNTPEIKLLWDLHDVLGWDKAVVNQNGDDYIYKGDQLLLNDFTTKIIVYTYSSAETSILITDDELTEDLINLSLYDLSFDFVTLNELNQDKTYLENNYESLLQAHGFIPETINHESALLDLIPFFHDEELFNEIFDELSEE
jgi:hypothetical protein